MSFFEKNAHNPVIITVFSIHIFQVRERDEKCNTNPVHRLICSKYRLMDNPIHLNTSKTNKILMFPRTCTCSYAAEKQFDFSFGIWYFFKDMFLLFKHCLNLVNVKCCFKTLLIDHYRWLNFKYSFFSSTVVQEFPIFYCYFKHIYLKISSIYLFTSRNFCYFIHSSFATPFNRSVFVWMLESYWWWHRIDCGKFTKATCTRFVVVSTYYRCIARIHCLRP